MTDKLLKYIQDHPLISIQGLEKTCKMPITTIAHALGGDRAIPKKYFKVLEKELSNYGYK